MSEKAPGSARDDNVINLKQHPLNKKETPKEKVEEIDEAAELHSYELAKQHLENPGEWAARVGKEGVKEHAPKVADRITHSVVGEAFAIADRAMLRMFDKPIVAAVERVHRWRSNRALGAEVRHHNLEQAASGVEQRLKKQEESLATLRNASYRNAGVEIKAENERQKLVKELESAKAKSDHAHKRHTSLNNKATRWENVQKNWVEKIVKDANEQMEPHIVQFESFKARHDELTTGIERLKTIQEQGKNGVRELEIQLKNKGTQKEERPEIKAKIASIKELLGRIDAEYASHKKEAHSISKRMNGTDRRLSGWKNYSNEFARVTNREHRQVYKEKEDVQENTAHRPSAYARSAKKNAAPATPTPEVVVNENILAPESPREARQEVVELLPMTPAAYVRLWNIFFGDKDRKELKLDLAKFRKETGLNVREEMSVDDNEKALRKYIVKEVRNGTASYTDKAIDRKLGEIRKELVKARKGNKK